MITLRPYQQELLDRTRLALGENRGVCVVSPTGSGKTCLFIYMVGRAARRGYRSTILVGSTVLLDQTSRELSAQGVPHGLIAAGHPESAEPVQVAMVQTLRRRLGRWHQPDQIIVDECQHATAATWAAVMEWLPEHTAVIGFTATPERLDGRGLGVSSGGPFNIMVEGPTVRELIEQGYLARPIVYAPPVVADLSGLRCRYGDYSKKELAEALDNSRVTGDAVAHYLRLCSGQPAVAFCCGIPHAQHVAAAFQRAGINAAHISGEMSIMQRRDILQRLADGRIKLLAAADLISEGFDLPIIRAALLLRATESLSLYCQQVGRALRPAPGKSHAIILDHVGNVLRHGLPETERQWSLEGRSGRAKAEPGISIRQCPQCYRAFSPPAPVCPYCGAEIAQKREQNFAAAAGELQAVDEDQIAEAQIAARELRSKRIARARTLDDFYKLAQEFRYKPGWAEVRYAVRHGWDAVAREKARLRRERTA